MLSIDIRPIRPVDLSQVQAAFPDESPKQHSGRLARQEAGEASYLIAWASGEVLGHTLLIWAGPDNEDIGALLPRAAAVEGLAVRSDWQGQGIGTRLVEQAERLARLRGIPHLSLGVSGDNPGARRLYKRLGFQDSGLGPFNLRWVEPDRTHRPLEVQATVHYLLKRLA